MYILPHNFWSELFGMQSNWLHSKEYYFSYSFLAERRAEVVNILQWVEQAVQL